MSDRYQIQKKIGQGGLGAVYQAFDGQLKRQVALKRVLTPEQASAEDVQVAADNLLKEAHVMSSLNHPNIVTVFDIGQDENGGFVVMELLDGETLDEVVSRGLLTLGDFEEVVNQTLEALIAAQAVHMLHRDLKPSNVMVVWRASGKFQVKVLDFGLAKVSEQPSVQTIDQGDAILGSIYFMAPEQFERRKLDFRTDMYALGCIYYHSLTGKYPFDGDTAPQVMASHLQHKVKTLKELRPDLPDDVCQWVMWLINRDMTKRPADANEALSRFPQISGATSGPVYVAQTVEPEAAVNPVSQVAAGSAPQPAVVQPAGHPDLEPTVSLAVPIAEAATTVAPAAPPPSQDSGAAPRISVPQTGPTSVPGVRPTGGVKMGTGGVSLTTGAVSTNPHVSSAVQLAIAEQERKKKMTIIIASIISATVILALGITFILGKQKAQRIRAHMDAIVAGSVTPTAEDVPLIVSFMSANPKLSHPAALRTLLGMEGPGIDRAIVAALKTAEPGEMREGVLNAAASRNLQEAFPTALEVFKTSTYSREKNMAAITIQRTATSKDLSSVISLLAKKMDKKDRTKIEDAIISVVRAEPNSDLRTAPVVKAYRANKGVEERRSLLRVLGAVGGDASVKIIEEIYSGNDLATQIDGVAALKAWSNREVLKTLTGILEKDLDPKIKPALIGAYVYLIGLPAKNTNESYAWKRALEISSTRDKTKVLYNVIARKPNQSAIDYLSKMKIPALEAQVKMTLTQVNKLVKASIPVGSGTLLEAKDAVLLGDNGAYQSKADNVITNWESPGTWIQWHVKFDQPGTYTVEAEVACDTTAGSQFDVLGVGDQLFGKVPKTKGPLDFTKVKVGPKSEITVDAKEIGPQIIYLRAGKVVEREIMNVRGLRLTKK